LADKSAIQRIKELDEERTKLLSNAKQEAMDRAKAAVSDLNDLGFNYRLTTMDELRNGAGKSKKAVRQKKDVPCSVCNFKTDPPHDARAHRGQKRKKPFSAQELKDKGYTQV
jgi:hypothetical protein